MPPSRVILAVRRSTQTILKNIQAVLTNRMRNSGDRLPGKSPAGFYRGIRFRLTLFVLLLIAATSFSIAIIVIQVMDRSLLHSLIQRGSAITQAAATPAGYSLLTNDRLALDNLAAQIQRAQTELVYVAILDLAQTIVAHNRLDEVGSNFALMPGAPLVQQSGLEVIRGLRDGVECFEFSRPIIFADQLVGRVVIGISTQELVTAKTTAHRNIFLIASAATAFALLGAMLLASIITRPIERLTEGVSRLQNGEQGDDIPVRSNDDLGILTHNFNLMTRVIQQQKENLQGYATELESSYGDMVRILAAALDARDNYTYGHSARVAQLALGLAEHLNFNQAELKELELACLLHDIGKIHVPDAILNKAGKLDHHELQHIVKHPVLGSQILELAPSLHKYIPTVKHHHERYDGSGYPDQLCGDAIPIHAQIVALADTYDAMTSSRPYRKGRSREEALQEIRFCSGSQFNPTLVEPFIETTSLLPDELFINTKRPEIACVS